MKLVISILITLVVLAVLVFWLLQRLQKKNAIKRSLQLKLLKIQLPREISKEDRPQGTQNLKEKIAMMEQLFSQLSNIRVGKLTTLLKGPVFFSFEIAMPSTSKELAMYLAVPKNYAASTQKAIEGVYPQAHIEESSDYTIFHPQSAVSGSSLKVKDKYLPLKTYQSIESDPLGSILSAFSRAAEQNEGLALQLVLEKAPSSAHQHLFGLSKHLRQGKTVSQARQEMKKTSTAQKKEDTPQVQPVLNQSLIDLIERKSQKILFTTNLRLVASAQTQERADALLSEIENPLQQFAQPEVNEWKASRQKGRNLQRLIYNFSFRLPDKAFVSYLSTEELASIVHLPNTELGISNLASTKAKYAPVPNTIPREGLLLGNNIYRSETIPVRTSDKDRERHFYVIGQTGTGKSVFLENMAMQDIQNGKGVCFIDPHGDACETLLTHIPKERIKDVIYFNPGDTSRPLGLNLLEYDPAFPEQKTFIINELLEIFNKLYDMKTAGGPMFEQYFRNATALVMDDPESGNTLLEINRVFVDKEFRNYKLSKTTNPLVKTFWKEVAEKAGGEASLQNIVPYVSSKFDTFLSNEIMRPIVTQEKSSINMRTVMDEGKILLINLSKGRLGALNSNLIGLLMVGKILMASFSRTDTAEKDRKPFYLYIDEFQNVTTDSIQTILSEARKYKLNLTIAHQFIGQLSEEIKKAVFGNVGSIAAFRVGAEDGEFLEKQFGPTFTQKDLINIDNYHCYLKLLINGQTSQPFSIATLPPTPGDQTTKDQAVEFSRLTYGRDKEVVVAEIMKKFESVQKKPEPKVPFPEI